MTIDYENPPEFKVSAWLNTKEPLTLKELKGKVVVVFAFQMLCPGCVEHSIPQAKRVRALFPEKDVAVIGLHTVFEHHDAMQPVSLQAFLHEYRVDFPVAIDSPAENAGDPIPQTMRLYQMEGTPTLLLFDKSGQLRKQKFGREQDMLLGAEIMMLKQEQSAHDLADTQQTSSNHNANHCTEDGCTI